MSKKVEVPKPARPAPSSNWLALRKKLPQKAVKDTNTNGVPRKRRKLEHKSASPEPEVEPIRSRTSYAATPLPPSEPTPSTSEMKNGESLPALRKMIFGQMEYTDSQKQPGKFLALDCEMVGVGLDGTESSLARVSLVNYYGAVQLDEFVRQRERVVDYRTQWSGVRESDMVKAKPFDDIQKRVAELLKDRILVGHAVFNDLKALLLSHPRPQTRDTQYYAGKFKLSPNGSRYVALRNLVKQELDLTIQGGEHSSVTDARATMAVYRLHRKEWEKGNKVIGRYIDKRKREADEEDDGEEEEERPAAFPGGGRKGVSSGLSTVIKRGNGSKTDRGGDGDGGGKSQWWKELGNAKGSKGSMRLQ